ncbi:nicotinamide riboside transporter PnuC [Olivibacter ginsenosidimutans]|uniref:Nicotinamide riboside transporter PnuC n=1 Tax=Olivibacter ginsenosidimutans TaxID=1176537 RepID=A0ABP9AYX3_9SPHI
MIEWYKLFLQQLLDTPLLQWIGVAFGVFEVVLAKANKIGLYPCGIISILITLYVLYEAGLYAEILLNLYYLVMSIYGWYYWIRKPNNHDVPITTSTSNDWLICIAMLVIGFPLLYLSLVKFTDSVVPICDAWVSITAWIGMWLLAKRKIENWIWLNCSNAFAIPLFIYKGLLLYALLTLFLFVLAIFGYISWKKKLRQTQHMAGTV